MIVDEEQRFGVEHKEYLKQLRVAVDVLTMSATPIPRTLEMSLTGIREMSTILTPPEERHPVLTFVGAYEEKQVAAAIHRELLREGQVFYIHNRVESIDRAAARLRELVPEARVVTAHGQMGEDALEQVMVGFWEREFDVLVCTTIVESGLDISNANTLIVERADAFGLSQLHQIRGRVGRGRERGYAYFLYPPEKPLTETRARPARHHRAEHRPRRRHGGGDEGPGDPRRRQPARRRAVRLHRRRRVRPVPADGRARPSRTTAGEAPEEHVEVKIDLPIDAHLPHDYLPGERLRLEAYRALATATSDEADRRRPRRARGPVRPRARAGGEPARGGPVQGAGPPATASPRWSGPGPSIRLAPLELPESKVMRLQRLYKGAQVKPALRAVLVPEPRTAPLGGQPLRDVALLQYLATLLADVVGEPAPAPAG